MILYYKLKDLFAYLKSEANTIMYGIVGYFLLGRECKRCKHDQREWMGMLVRYRHVCTLDTEKKEECCNSITLKHFERK